MSIAQKENRNNKIVKRIKKGDRNDEPINTVQKDCRLFKNLNKIALNRFNEYLQISDARGDRGMKNNARI